MTESGTAKRRAAVALLLAMVLLGVFPLDVVLPSFPALSSHFNRSTSDIAFSVSLFAVGISLSQLLIGPLSDTLGRKGLLLAGMLISILGGIGCVLVSDFTWFLFFRCIQAIGCGSFVLTQALVQDLFVGKARDQLRILMITASGYSFQFPPWQAPCCNRLSIGRAVFGSLSPWPRWCLSRRCSSLKTHFPSHTRRARLCSRIDSYVATRSLSATG